jgi:hypothetical protein
MFRKRRLASIAALSMVTLADCASQPLDGVDRSEAPGFFSGLLHGFIAWFALIGHFFNDDISVYAFPNSGGWYDFGFLLGAGFWAAFFWANVIAVASDRH